LDDLFKTIEEKIDEIKDQGYDVKQMWGKIMVISPLLKWYVEMA
jgi:biotin operon repressor